MTKFAWIAAPAAPAFAFVFALAAGTAAHAQDATALFASHGCTNCHAVDTRKVGPAFADIADQYNGNAGAEAKLVAELRDGTGHPKIAAPESDIKTMIDAVLATK